MPTRIVAEVVDLSAWLRRTDVRTTVVKPLTRGSSRVMAEVESEDIIPQLRALDFVCRLWIATAAL